LATHEQYEFFKLLYEEEGERYGQLEARAKLYLGVITIFLATLLFKAGEVKASVTEIRIPWALVLIEAALLAASLMFTVFGSLIRTYEGLADPEEIIKKFSALPPKDEDFLDDRIVDFAVATNRDSKVNDRTAMFLSFAGILLSAAMVVIVLMIGAALRP